MRGVESTKKVDSPMNPMCGWEVTEMSRSLGALDDEQVATILKEREEHMKQR